jgi:hypothetical protein
MVLNYFNNLKMEHSVEEEIAINSASEFTDGQHYS